MCYGRNGDSIALLGPSLFEEVVELLGGKPGVNPLLAEILLYILRGLLVCFQKTFKYLLHISVVIHCIETLDGLDVLISCLSQVSATVAQTPPLPMH